MRRASQWVLAGLAGALWMSNAAACGLRSRVGSLDLAIATLTEVRTALDSGAVTSEKLVTLYLARIRACDRDTRAILALNPDALAEARRADQERRGHRLRGPLHGVPIVIKDNIDVAGMVTTAGSLALRDNLRAQDAPVVRKLREAGAIVLAKTNLSEWANFRARQSSSGWSAVGGLTRNAYDRARTACGSSAGSAVAVALRFAPAAVGTETNGSIVCPASVNGIVGLKPTAGMISTEGIVPISNSQDTAGPMTASVEDAALLWSVMASSAKDSPPAPRVDSLAGRRLGVARFIKGYSPATEAAFQRALDALKARGAVLVDITQFDYADLRDLTLPILLTEFKAGIDPYLATTPAAVRTRTLADLIAFNLAEPRELEWFGQDLFEEAQATAGLRDPAYLQARRRATLLAGEQGIDRLLREHEVVALLAPTSGPAWSVDLINGDRSVGSASMLAAVAGYPHLTVPMGRVGGLPVGLSIFATAGSEETLLALGSAVECRRCAGHDAKRQGAFPH
jgi:amidase